MKHTIWLIVWGLSCIICAVTGYVCGYIQFGWLK